MYEASLAIPQATQPHVVQWLQEWCEGKFLMEHTCINIAITKVEADSLALSVLIYNEGTQDLSTQCHTSTTGLKQTVPRVDHGVIRKLRQFQ